eukprot:9054214-Pyramimonas_sp.AAC.1
MLRFWAQRCRGESRLWDVTPWLVDTSGKSLPARASQDAENGYIAKLWETPGDYGPVRQLADGSRPRTRIDQQLERQRARTLGYPPTSPPTVGSCAVVGRSTARSAGRWHFFTIAAERPSKCGDDAADDNGDDDGGDGAAMGT